ncbi:hypothetical protein ACIP2X_37990 [Streptomyces sp. NPDC089424]|uniref:hypothetical protein n=1 Tax=Streptomyces sp. NPDC089424 TaxID=3365917 RepID=UPI00381B2E2F
MENRIGQAAPNRTATSKTTSALRQLAAQPIGPRMPGRPKTRPIPMPGRLVVDYYDWDLRQALSPTLDEVATGTLVTAYGTITNVLRLSGGRAMVVLSSDDGNSAHVQLNADTVRMVTPALFRGNRLHVRGAVTRTSPNQPAGIDGRGVQVEIV